MKKKLLHIFMSWVFSIVILFVIFSGLFILNQKGDNMFFELIFLFLKDNLIFIILISSVFFIAEIFFYFDFPINIPAPIINGIGSIFLINLIFEIFAFIGGITQQDIFMILISFSVFIYPLVFIIVLISGYFLILARIKKKSKKESENENEFIKDINKDKKSWNDIEDEFRETLYEGIHAVKKSIVSEKDSLKKPRKSKQIKSKLKNIKSNKNKKNKGK
jgi:uncharacterized membrane protein